VLGPEKCSRLPAGTCGIAAFLTAQKEACGEILKKLKSLPKDQKSQELREAERFLEFWLLKPDKVSQKDPCLTVGDLLIALESVGVECFFTLNSKESQHLCRALGQSLIVRPINPEQLDIVCEKEQEQWPAFGQKE
jgi:hypothetical protein